MSDIHEQALDTVATYDSKEVIRLQKAQVNMLVDLGSIADEAEAHRETLYKVYEYLELLAKGAPLRLDYVEELRTMCEITLYGNDAYGYDDDDDLTESL